MIYQFKCSICGNYREVVRTVDECALPEYCGECFRDGVAMVMDRVFSVPQVNISGTLKGEYNPGLGCVINSRKDVREARRRIYNETGRDVVEIGNEKMVVSPRRKEYEIPRGVFDNAVTE